MESGPRSSPLIEFLGETTYQLLWLASESSFVVRDPQGRDVAIMTGQFNGEARAGENRFAFSVQRRRVTWAIVARVLPSGDIAGEAVPGWLPGVCNIKGDWGSWRLTRNPLTASFLLWAGRRRIARLSAGAVFVGSGFASPRAGGHLKPGVLETFAGANGGGQLGLPMLLALEMIKAQRATPVPDVVNPGGR